MYEPGGRAMDYLKKYPGRFFSMHVKDEMKKEPPPQKGNQYESCLLGKGVIAVKQIVEYARKSGIKYFIIEQEDYPDLNPMEAAAYDLKVMQGWGF
jgi:sugar phosphate isomerase/epimerase